MDKQEEKNIEITSLQEVREKWMEDAAFKSAYDALEWKYVLIQALLKARMEKGFSQTELARRIGTKQSAISRFESGRYNPSIDFIQKLSKELGLQLEITVR